MIAGKFDRLDNLMAEADAAFEILKEQTAKAGRPVTCCKGCHACCSEPLYTSSLEADNVMAAIPSRQLDYVKERLEAWRTSATSSGWLKVRQPAAAAWLSAKIPCPLLKDGLCLVYEKRPYGCRDFLAIGPPKLCGSPETRPKQRYAVSNEITAHFGQRLLMLQSDYDHLGAWLVRKMLQLPMETADHTVIEITYEP